MDDGAAATCGSQRTLFLSGRRNSCCSLGLVWHRVVGFSSGFSRRDGFEAGACHPPKLFSFWIKYPFPFLTKPLPLEFACMGGGRPEPHFYSVTLRTFFSFLFYCCSVTVVPISPPLLSPALSTPTFYIQSSPCLLLSLSMCPLFRFLDPSPCYPPLPSLMVTVSSLFLCLWFYFCFVDYVPLIGEIIWYLSFTAWLISLSIILSSSIHTVTKGRSSLFRSAV